MQGSHGPHYFECVSVAAGNDIVEAFVVCVEAPIDGVKSSVGAIEARVDSAEPGALRQPRHNDQNAW